VCCVLQRCVAAAKATFKAIAVSEPRIRGAAKAALRDALQQRFELVREAVLARAAAKVDHQLLKAAQQISTVRQDPAWFLAQVYPSLFPVVQPCSGSLHCVSSAINRHAGMLTLSHPQVVNFVSVIFVTVLPVLVGVLSFTCQVGCSVCTTCPAVVRQKLGESTR
jgi:hypothetical protein